jgi:hypothetical protein
MVRVRDIRGTIEARPRRHVCHGVCGSALRMTPQQLGALVGLHTQATEASPHYERPYSNASPCYVLEPPKVASRGAPHGCARAGDMSDIGSHSSWGRDHTT